MTLQKKGFRYLLTDWGPLIIWAAILLLAPMYLSEFRLNLLGKFLTFAIVAIGLDLIWGYGGMLSLGQGLFFGIGAYAFAMYLKLESGAGRLPDFMVWSGMTELPAFWQPFTSPVFAIAMVLIAPTAIAAILGYFVFRSRIQGVYFSIITQALTLIVSISLIGQQPYTGGTNGITNLSTIFGYSLADPQTQVALYLSTVIILGIIYILARMLTRSRFGRLLVATRDDEARVRFLGYSPVTIKTTTFAISAACAGIGGALFVPQVGIISPAALAVVPSIMMVIWVAVGGRATLVGAVVGALLVNAGQSAFSEQFPNIWQYFLGALFVGAVLLFPQGVVGTYRSLFARLGSGSNRATAPVEEEAAIAGSARLAQEVD
ncbi:MAG: urea ABC transporter permease subunit UrtC [Anaerolineae bacterium]|nr:urea ABC transporter permease subunit UrtC [Anaerolineae bacterium]